MTVNLCSGDGYKNITLLYFPAVETDSALKININRNSCLAINIFYYV